MRESDICTPDQSEDNSQTIPTYRQREEKGKIVEDHSRDRAVESWMEGECQCSLG